MNGYLSLGSNLGRRERNLKWALHELENRGVELMDVSSIHETKPFDVGEFQGPYLNLAARISWEGEPLELLDLCQNIENDLGRKRPYPNAPRTIDIDILLLDECAMAAERLTLPHPEMERRAFVIYPLSELQPDLIMPSGKDIMTVKKALKSDEILRVWKLEWRY